MSKNFNKTATFCKHQAAVKFIFHHTNDFKLPFFLLICVLYDLSFKHVYIAHSSIRLHLHFITSNVYFVSCLSFHSHAEASSLSIINIYDRLTLYN